MYVSTREDFYQQHNEFVLICFSAPVIIFYNYCWICHWPFGLPSSITGKTFLFVPCVLKESIMKMKGKYLRQSHIGRSYHVGIYGEAENRSVDCRGKNWISLNRLNSAFFFLFSYRPQADPTESLSLEPISHYFRVRLSAISPTESHLANEHISY